MSDYIDTESIKELIAELPQKTNITADMRDNLIINLRDVNQEINFPGYCIHFDIFRMIINVVNPALVKCVALVQVRNKNDISYYYVLDLKKLTPEIENIKNNYLLLIKFDGRVDTYSLVISENVPYDVIVEKLKVCKLYNPTFKCRFIDITTMLFERIIDANKIVPKPALIPAEKLAIKKESKPDPLPKKSIDYYTYFEIVIEQETRFYVIMRIFYNGISTVVKIPLYRENVIVKNLVKCDCDFAFCYRGHNLFNNLLAYFREVGPNFVKLISDFRAECKKYYDTMNNKTKVKQSITIVQSGRSILDAFARKLVDLAHQENHEFNRDVFDLDLYR
jgi:hypothetical protein